MFTGLGVLVLLAVGWVVLKWRLRLPELEPRSQTVALPLAATNDTRLGRALAPWIEAHPGRAGIYTLPDGYDAFSVRMSLADLADRTLDVQYYIWHHDTSGALLFDALRRAADRGVRVRLLLDDNNTGGLDEALAALDAHPNLEVRLFNPFHRAARLLGYLVDFGRVNRRMHNKSFTADGQTTVVGGRNVADEYFTTRSDRVFVDLDVLAVGPIAQEVSHDFDRYWNSGSAFPAERILPRQSPQQLARVEAASVELQRSAAAERFQREAAERAFDHALLAGALPFEWAVTHLLSDDPAKVLDRAPRASLLWSQMKHALGPPRASLGLVSPYFVPTRTGTESLVSLAREGVRVRVLTNSLEATDLAIVHAGYAKHRQALLSGGVELFEIKREFVDPTVKEHGFAGSSSASLHAKVFLVDRRRAFVGSFNFDPRSARLNTELGLVIESERLATAVSESLERQIPIYTYRVQLGASGSLEWLEQINGHEELHQTEPGSSRLRRGLVKLLSWLPIDWLL